MEMQTRKRYVEDNLFASDWAAFAVLGFGLALGMRDSATAQTTPVTIRIRDACDPKTFNQVVGPGTCIAGNHGTTGFNLFIAEVTSDKFAGGWRFNPLLDTDGNEFNLQTLNLNAGRQTALRNTGGEVHTFTRVVSYGGGVVPALNTLSGNPTPAPECMQAPSGRNFFIMPGTVRTGPVAGSSALPVGTSKWQCCIHPWMRMRIAVHPN
jgi:hypothetical protein